MEDSSVEAWRLRALASASDLGIPISEVNASAAILVNALGRQTFRELTKRIDRSIALPLRAHAIGRAISTPGAASVVTIVELAAYLVEVADDPAFPEVASSLVAHYYNTLPQLALAYRLSHLGATGVTLEPELPDGRRADIEAEYCGRVVVVECYRPTVAGRPQHHESFIGRAILHLVSDWAVPIAVGILVRRRIDMDIRRRIVGTTKKLCEAVREGGFTHSEHHNGPELEISVAPTIFVGPGQDSALTLHPRFPRDLGKPTFFMRIGKAPKAEVEQLAPTLSYPTGSCLGIWESPPSPELPESPSTALRRLLRKARKKMGQTKISKDNLRVLVLDSWVTDYLDEIQDVTDAFSDGLLRHHEGDICAICIRRSWDSGGQRFRYKYRSFLRETASVGQTFSNALQKWESENVVPPYSSS